MNMHKARYTEGEQARIDAGMCICGCSEQASPSSVYANEKHRKRRYRAKVKAAATAAGLPANLSLESVEASTPTKARTGDAPAARKRRKSGPSIRVSYRKAVEAVAAEIGDTDRAHEMLMPLLTDRQKEALRAT